MKKALLISLLFIFSSVLSASNQPGEEIPWPILKESAPAWVMLENLTPAERSNAIIQVELFSDANSEAVQHAQLVEDKWNNGDYNDAIELFQQFTDLNDAAIGIQWKEPITTSSSSKWGTDVQIGTDDSIYVVDLDVDNITGHLFSVLLHPSGGYYHWDVYFSADTGKTWSETYTWNGGSSYITDVSCAVVGNRFYVAYVYDGAPKDARLRRFYTSDGTSDATYGYVTVNTEADTIKDIVLATNADYYNNRIYYLDILANNSLKYYWDDTTATSWTAADPAIGNAYKGLDATCNEGFSTYFFWVSYIGTDYKIYVAGKAGSWHNFGALDTSSTYPGVSSIGAYKDTVITIYKEASSPNRAKYRITYNGGSSWLYGFISDSTTYCFDVTSRGGDGMGVAYQEWNGVNWSGMYRHRTYTSYNPWTTPVSFADYEPRIIVKPAIERVASGIYGIVYVDYPNQNAYFDRSDFVGINENPDIETNVVKLLGNYPNPFSHYTTIKYQIAKRVNVSLKVYDISGKLVKTIVEGEKGPGSYTATWNGMNNDGNKVSSGVYFYRLSTGNAGVSKKMILLK